MRSAFFMVLGAAFLAGATYAATNNVLTGL